MSGACGERSELPVLLLSRALNVVCWPAWSVATAAACGSLVGSMAQPAIVTATEAAAISAFTPPVFAERLLVFRCANCCPRFYYLLTITYIASALRSTMVKAIKPAVTANANRCIMLQFSLVLVGEHSRGSDHGG